MIRSSYIPFLLALFQTLFVFGQNQQKVPRINDHTFVPTSALEYPFTNSYFQSKLGIAQSSSAKIPLFEINGKTIFGNTGGLLMANLGFTYQHQVKDWFAFNTTFTLNSRVGTNINSLLSQGINTVSGFRLQWLLKIAHGDKYLLSGAFTVSNFNGSFISVSRFVKDVIDGKTNPSISTSVPAVNSSLGLRYVYGFNDLLGLQLVGDINYGEGFARGEPGVSYKVGGSVDINLYERTAVPLGFIVTYFQSTQPENVFNEIEPFRVTAFKIAYTGSSDYIIGIETSYLRIPIIVSTDKINLIGLVITTRYYFN